MIAAKASSTQATRVRKPSRLSSPARGLPSRGAVQATQKVTARPASTKMVNGVPTLPSPKACTESITPLRTR